MKIFYLKPMCFVNERMMITAKTQACTLLYKNYPQLCICQEEKNIIMSVVLNVDFQRTGFDIDWKAKHV